MRGTSSHLANSAADCTARSDDSGHLLTMKALRFYEKGDIRLEDIPIPYVQPALTNTASTDLETAAVGQMKYDWT